jgi:hypothetical protein
MPHHGVATIQDPARLIGHFGDAPFELGSRQLRPVPLVEDAVELDVRDVETVGEDPAEG